MLVLENNESNWTVTLTNASGGASSKNTFSLGLFLEAPLGGADISRVANIFRDALTPLLDNSWTVGPVHVLFKQSDVLQTADDTGTEAGTHAAQAYASPAVSHVIKKVTGRAGRRFRGRIYFPAVPEADVDEAGVLDGTHVNAVTTAFRGLRTSLIADAAVGSLILLHDSESPGDHEGTTIIDLVCGNIVGTMRPRQRR